MVVKDVASLTVGTKFDATKLRYDLVAPDALAGLTEVLTFGAQKYEARNWELGMEWMRVYAALMRHMQAWAMGEDIDPESGKPHIDLAQCCVHFLSAYQKRGVGTDNRVKL